MRWPIPSHDPAHGDHAAGPGISDQPVISRWELWSVATMLIASHGDDAESHADGKLREAVALDDEAAVIVWQGVLTQLARIRAGA